MRILDCVKQKNYEMNVNLYLNNKFCCQVQELMLLIIYEQDLDNSECSLCGHFGKIKEPGKASVIGA